MLSLYTTNFSPPKLERYLPAALWKTKAALRQRELEPIFEALEEDTSTSTKTKTGHIDREVKYLRASSRIYPPDVDSADPMIAASKKAEGLLGDCRILLADDDLQLSELAAFLVVHPNLIGSTGTLQEKMAPLQEIAADLGCGLKETMQTLKLYSNSYPVGRKLCPKPPKPKKLSRENRVRLEEQRDRVEVQEIKLQTINRWLMEDGGPGFRYSFSANHLRGMPYEEVDKKINNFYIEACFELMNAVPKEEVTSL